MQRNKASGFTLLELLIVVAILAIIGGGVMVAYDEHLGPGYVRVAAWRPGRARAEGFAFLPQLFAHAVVLELQPEAGVALEVIDAESGAPVPGAWIAFDHDPAPDSFRTGADGRAALHGLAPGEAPRVRVDAAGYLGRVVPADAGSVALEPADRTVRWPLRPPLPPDGTAVELRRQGLAGHARVEGGHLVAHGLPRGAWPEHEAWAPGPLVARVEAERGVADGAPVRFAEPRRLTVTLLDDGPVHGLPLRLEDPATGQPLTDVRTDGRFLRADGRRVRLSYREPGARRWRPLRDVTAGDVTVRLPRAKRVVLTGGVPDRLAVYVERERYRPARRRDGSLVLELRPHPGRERARVDLLAHGRVAAHREFDLTQPGEVEWPVELEPGSALVMRVRGGARDLVLADPETGRPRWRGPWWFRLEAGPDGIVRDSMIPPGVHVVRDLVRGVSSAPFAAPGDRERSARVDAPVDDLVVPLSPVADLRLIGADGGRIVARDADGRRVTVASVEGEIFRGFPPGMWDLWIDRPGRVPIEVEGVRLAEGANELEAEGEAGAVLKVRSEGDVPLSVAAWSMTEPRYARTGDGEVAGLGPGRFRVMVWDRFTGLRLFEGEIESPGRGEIPLVLDLD